MLAWFGDLEVVDDLVWGTGSADGDAFHGRHVDISGYLIRSGDWRVVMKRGPEMDGFPRNVGLFRILCPFYMLLCWCR